MPVTRRDKTHLFVVYMFTGFLFLQEFDAREVPDQDPARDLRECPGEAYGFYYAKGPEEVGRISDFTLYPRMYFIDAVIVPTARLADYVLATGACNDVNDILINTEGVAYHAHTRNGRFFTFEMGRDHALSTEVVTSPHSLTATTAD